MEKAHFSLRDDVVPLPIQLPRARRASSTSLQKYEQRIQRGSTCVPQMYMNVAQRSRLYVTPVYMTLSHLPQPNPKPNPRVSGDNRNVTKMRKALRSSRRSHQKLVIACYCISSTNSRVRKITAELTWFLGDNWNRGLMSLDICDVNTLLACSWGAAIK